MAGRGALTGGSGRWSTVGRDADSGRTESHPHRAGPRAQAAAAARRRRRCSRRTATRTPGSPTSAPRPASRRASSTGTSRPRSRLFAELVRTHADAAAPGAGGGDGRRRRSRHPDPPGHRGERACSWPSTARTSRCSTSSAPTTRSPSVLRDGSDVYADDVVKLVREAQAAGARPRRRSPPLRDGRPRRGVVVQPRPPQRAPRHRRRRARHVRRRLGRPRPLPLTRSATTTYSGARISVASRSGRSMSTVCVGRPQSHHLLRSPEAPDQEHRKTVCGHCVTRTRSVA